MLWETLTGCKLQKTFQSAETKYVSLTVRDSDGDTNTNRKSFAVAAATTPPPPADVLAKAVWTAPVGATIRAAVTLDGSASQGDAPRSCSWSFENEAGTVVWETITGCKIQKQFANADTKYVKLTVVDNDGDTNSSKKSFAVAR